jgi:hypothetical protein
MMMPAVGPAPGKLLIDRRAHRLIKHLRAEKKSDQMLTTQQLAAWLEVSVQFLEIARTKGPGFGPPFKQLSPRLVRYRCGDVTAWLQLRTFASTSEYDKKACPAE